MNIGYKQRCGLNEGGVKTLICVKEISVSSHRSYSSCHNALLVGIIYRAAEIKIENCKL